MFGLNEPVLHDMRLVFAKHGSIKQVKIFGSRAIGNYRSNSDIDVALFGDVNLQNLANIHQSLEDLSTPYQFDVVAYDLIEHPALKEHIDRVGIILELK